MSKAPPKLSFGLLEITFAIDSSAEIAEVKLIERVAIVLSTPQQIARFGGLSLGESWAMVNGVRIYREEDGSVRWLTQDKRGLIGLPIWINRVTTQGTFARLTFADEFTEDCWVGINPPTPSEKPIKAKSTRKSKG